MNVCAEVGFASSTLQNYNIPICTTPYPDKIILRAVEMSSGIFSPVYAHDVVDVFFDSDFDSVYDSDSEGIVCIALHTFALFELNLNFTSST